MRCVLVDGMVVAKRVVAVAIAISSFGVALAADWYAKDNLQPGHDPSMIRFEDGYALMSTNNQLSLWTSEDAYSWKAHGKTMNGNPSWLRQYAPGLEDVWAPDIFYANGEYRVYYCGSEFGKRNSAIGYTASKSIVPNTAGYGWTDKGHVIHTKEGVDKYNAIDADLVRTVEGNLYMAFGSFGLGIQLIKIDEATGFQANDDKTIYNIARRTSKASGGAEEGPSLIEHNGQYFLFTAWDKCCQQGANIEQTTYKTAYGRADKVTGPYKDRAGYDMASGGGSILLERYGRYVGPGGGEAFQDINRVRFVHHYYDNAGDKYNHIHIRDVVFTEDNWAEMGQPFLGRYLSAEAEHAAMTRAVSGDLQITSSKTASNGEYVAYINTKGSKLRFPMNIPQAGEYLLRYRYANGDAANATHNLTVNGKSQVVTLPPTEGWGTFPEKSIVNIPVTLKRGGNFIEVAPGENFSELDRIDFLRIVRDTLPGNGFDNGIRIRLDAADQLAIKDGGYAIFENVVTDSIKDVEVSVQMKSCAGGTLSLRTDSKSGTEISKCSVPTTCGAESWVDVACSNLPKLSGVKDFYLTATGVTGELLVGNIKFKGKATETKKDTVATDTSKAVADTTAKDSGSESLDSLVGDTLQKDSLHTQPEILKNKPFRNLNYFVRNAGRGIDVHFGKVGAYRVFLLNSMGQVVRQKDVHGMSCKFEGLPKGNFIVRVK